MKPRINLAETELPDGSLLTLQEHDGRKALLVHGQQICGPSTRSAEEELARLACAPFRPARQPKIWLCGLGLGQTLAAVVKELPQKRGNFIVAEPTEALSEWHKSFIPDSPLSDPRVHLQNSCDSPSLTKEAGSLHAILMHLDASPLGPRNRPWVDERRWVSAAYESLQQGGLLAITGSRHVANLTRRLQGSGFEVAEFTIPSSLTAKRPRYLPIWLARKGKAAD